MSLVFRGERLLHSLKLPVVSKNKCEECSSRTGYHSLLSSISIKEMVESPVSVAVSRYGDLDESFLRDQGAQHLPQ